MSFLDTVAQEGLRIDWSLLFVAFTHDHIGSAEVIDYATSKWSEDPDHTPQDIISLATADADDREVIESALARLRETGDGNHGGRVMRLFKVLEEFEWDKKSDRDHYAHAAEVRWTLRSSAVDYDLDMEYRPDFEGLRYRTTAEEYLQKVTEWLERERRELSSCSKTCEDITHTADE